MARNSRSRDDFTENRRYFLLPYAFFFSQFPRSTGVEKDGLAWGNRG